MDYLLYIVEFEIKRIVTSAAAAADGFYNLRVDNNNNNNTYQVNKNEVYPKAQANKVERAQNFDLEHLEEGWECPKCTVINKPYRKLCDTCDHPRPPEYNIPDNYKMTDAEALRILNSERENERLLQELLVGFILI